MTEIIAVVAVGIVIGLSGLLRGGLLKLNGRVQTLWLILLIFSMGVGIGNSPEVTENIAQLGFQALVYALFAVLGSVALVFLFGKLVLEGRKRP